jgi:3-phosphoshikimate 1-carboxyvinyltransferase
MKHWRVSKSKLQGRIKVPSSKSQSIRALLFALLADPYSKLTNLLPSPDVEAMITACQHLGAHISGDFNELFVGGVRGKILKAEDVIQAGNSGLVLRLIGACAGLGKYPIILTGDHSLRYRRPVVPLLDALCQLGAMAISTREDAGAPIIVKGPLTSGKAVMDGEDSQPVSGMLIAAAFAQGPIELIVKNAGEKPWIDVTTSWFARFHIPCMRQNYTCFKLMGNSRIEGFQYRIPGDFSSMAYPLVGALLTKSELQIENLDFSDPQGDKKLIYHLQKMGAPIEIDPSSHSIFVKKCSSLEGITINVNDCIDATPILAVAGCYAEGRTEIKGASISRKKESDRISCMIRELRKMGASIEEYPDGFSVKHSPLQGALVESFADHRLALSLAIAGMAAEGETIITGISCVNKSYPNFCSEMQKLGAQMSWL